MTSEEILNQIIAFAAQVYLKDASKLSGATRIATELGTKSLDVMGMTALIENTYDVVIPLAEYGSYETLSDLAAAIAEQA